ncbi:hypothetical protein LTR37_020085 [Vermiconidia calcicola]|uniref:Uncharacterized protein n=1 Tax=Vermiconidia calcicola TaxID=1690605 RepID=A0ACC3MC75_9PEZI|nr:hypothetical protein LTR37_020085 [Vermiconidia calcicola]
MEDEPSKDYQRSKAIREGRYLSMTQSINDTDLAPYNEHSKEDDHPPGCQDYASSETLASPRSSAPWERESINGSLPDFRASLLPPPLAIKPKSSGQASPNQETQHRQHGQGSTKTSPPTDNKPLPPARAYGGAASKIKEHLGVDEVTVDFSYLRPPPDPSRPQPMLPSPSTKNLWRSSMSRFSLTPSEMPYPMQMLRAAHNQEEGHQRAEEVLGLRRYSVPPPLPLKNPARTSLPLRKSPESLEVVQDSDTEEPLNGRTAWLHSLTGMLVVFNCWGISNAFGLFQAFFTEEFLPGTSPSAIAWIGSTQMALVFGLGVPVGRMVDKGYFRIMFHGGSLIMIFGIFLSSVCKQLWSLWLVNGLITGIGMGMCFCSGMVALMAWFDERKVGAAMGLGAAGSCVGGIVYVLLARHFLKTEGYYTTMIVLGGVATVTMIPPNLVFRVRGQRHRSRSRRATGAKVAKINWRTFASTSYLLAAAGMFFAFLGVYFGFVYMISFASNILHLSDGESSNLLIYMLTANLPGRFLPALISDRCIGPLNTIIPSVFLSSAVIWLWTASGEHKSSLTVIACFYGFVSAGIQVLYAPTVYSFCLEPVQQLPRKSNASDTESLKQESTQLAMDRIGVKAGGIFTCVGFACLIGLPIGGALISYRVDKGMNQPYLGAQIFAGVSLLIGGCLLLGSRVAKSGWAAKRA